jgi:membrane peptidoglycan carboxypeptidase
MSRELASPRTGTPFAAASFRRPRPRGDVREVVPIPDASGSRSRRSSLGRGWSRRARTWIVRLAVVALVLSVLLSLVGFVFELTLPSVSDAPGRVAAIARTHHAVLGTLPVPTKLAAAVVAVEDEHFYSNVFVNVFDGAARGALAAIRQRGDPGGSTIAQQLAKQLYPHGTGFSGTLNEIGLGVKLSLTFSKSQILAMYLNSIYYGHGFWGDTAAARGYFGTDPANLSWAEAAMLAGLPQAPSAYDPVEHLALAKSRQRHVLDLLVVNHDLSEAQADAAFRVALPLRGH